MADSGDQKRKVEPKMRLWLDDMRPMPPDYDITTDDVDYAIKLVSLDLITHIGFDHDLGKGEDKEGRKLARFIEEEAFHGTIKPLTWSIQSTNPEGMREITQAMRNAERFWEKKSNG